MRKWGHYDTSIPVYVRDVQIFGAWNSQYAPFPPGLPPFPSYELRIKSVDWTGGLAAVANQGEIVTATDFNGVANTININNVISYWKDFDYSGAVNASDLNIVSQHLNHTCDFPNNP